MCAGRHCEYTKESKNKQIFVDRVRNDQVRIDRVRNDRVRYDQVRNHPFRNDRLPIVTRYQLIEITLCVN